MKKSESTSRKETPEEELKFYHQECHRQRQQPQSHARHQDA